jgi:hypothetical protein
MPWRPLLIAINTKIPALVRIRVARLITITPVAPGSSRPLLASQYLDRRIADKQILAHARQDYRNKHHAKAN